jgi:hypothetical protein
MEDNIMALKSASGYRYYEIDLDALDTTKLLEVAEHYGFPRINVGAPDESVRIHIAPTRSAWEQAVQILERYGLLELAYLVLDDLYGDLEDLPDHDIPESFHAVRAHEMLLMWDKWLDRVRSLNRRDYRRVSVMLAYAEAQNFPELVLTEYDYTIRGDMDGWLTAAKLFAGTPAIVLATEKLIKQSANGNPLAPTTAPLPCFTAFTTTEIHITGG